MQGGREDWERGQLSAYGKNLSPAQVTAIVAFLQTMHPAGEHPARRPLP